MPRMTLEQEIILNDCDVVAEITYYTSVEDDQCVMETIKLNDLVVVDIISLIGGHQCDSLTEFAEEEEFYRHQRAVA